MIISDYNERQENMADSLIKTVMYKNAGCQCCDKWLSYMRQYGYDITVRPVSNMPEIKDNYDVPGNMESCHTTLINDYVVEGHVPMEDIRRLIKEKPNVVGIAAPGMPAGSPGMNTALNDPYDVYSFGSDGNS